MLSFQRIIKLPADQLNNFIIVLQRSLRHACSPGRQESTSAVAIRIRPPNVSRTSFLLASLIPVVKAWSPWKKSDDDYLVPRYVKPLRLVDKKDQGLREDIRKADELYESGNPVAYEEAFEILAGHLEKREPEVLWRIARLIYEKVKFSKTKQERQRYTEEAYDLVFKAMTIDEGNFAVHKWMAILLNELSIFKGIKAQILESVNVKKHMLRAAELNPDDPTGMYLLGHWCYSVADIPWYQRKLAATLFATPPECTFEEAYKEFLKAEVTQPGFYSMNLLMLAKSCIKTGNMEQAETYLVKLEKLKQRTEDDFLAKQEGKQLLQDLFKARDFDPRKEPAKQAEN